MTKENINEPNETTYLAMESAEKEEDMYGPFSSVGDLIEALNNDCERKKNGI